MRKSSKHSRHVSLLSAFCCDKRKCASRGMYGTYWLQHKPTRLFPALESGLATLNDTFCPFPISSFLSFPLPSPPPFVPSPFLLSFSLSLSFAFPFFSPRPLLFPSPFSFLYFPPKSSQKVWGSAVSSPAGSGAENWIDVNCNCTNAQL